jgi:transposase
MASLARFVVEINPSPTGCLAQSGGTNAGKDCDRFRLANNRNPGPAPSAGPSFCARACETITQPPAPFHVTPRGFAGPQLLAMILFEKFGQHQPLNRQSERYRREGIGLSLSTLADQVGACTTVLQRKVVRPHEHWQQRWPP